MPSNQQLTLIEGMPFGLRSITSWRLSPATILHDDPGLIVVVVLDVVQGDQVGVLQVQALADASQLDVQVALNAFERDFLAGVADGEVDFAEAADADAPFDRVAVERFRAAGQ